MGISKPAIVNKMSLTGHRGVIGDGVFLGSYSHCRLGMPPGDTAA
jgi:hypothetical protein